ncbi:S-adenosyl-L-methionine-dependent methyltransferase [Sanghuangporus baumii]|uniref:S-adenosyl-L-methionine-dependent methyltransferase n=1 Tax=Sanghuangporus baumii TaxID=108892 RepID=A0A9Q5HVI4_SANBA|nr:S-adenosyl-L-methionine-dependent methyltransferase [Sanghuangporus baumii]
MVSEVDARASVAFSQGKSEAYNKSRPDYPNEAYSFMKSHVLRTGPLNIVEIGAGTGLFTRGLLAHPDWSQAISKIKAIEPSTGMREVFSDAVQDPRASIREGTFDRTGIEDGYRVPWVIQLWDYVARYDESRMHQCERWRGVYDSPLYNQNFEPSVRQVFSHDMICAKGTVVGHVLSWSAIARLDDEGKWKVKTDVLEIIERGEGVEWADEDEGHLKFPHDVEVAIIKRRDTS